MSLKLLIPLITEKWSLYNINREVEIIFDKYKNYVTWPLLVKHIPNSTGYRRKITDSYQELKPQYPRGRFITILYATFNFEVIRVIRCIDCINLELELVGVYQIKFEDLRSIPLEVSQLGYKDIDEVSLRMILIEEIKSDMDLGILQASNQHFKFLSQVIKNGKSHIIIQKDIKEKASNQLVEWLKEWDVELGGLAAQAAKKEFEGLVEANGQQHDLSKSQQQKANESLDNDD